MMIQKTKIITLLATVILLPITLSGCGDSTPDNQTHVNVSKSSEAQIISPVRKNLVATVSSNATVQKDANFSLFTPTIGAFTPKVNDGQQVKKGDVLAISGNTPITAPFDATIEHIEQHSQQLPAHYPAITLHYTGFALSATSNSLSRLGTMDNVSGKFQISEGVGPTDCVAVSIEFSHSPDSENNQQNISGSSPLQAVCIIDNNTPVREGENALIVLKGVQKTQVLTLPVSAVAGRLHKGQVTVIDGNHEKQVNVELGVSDGGYIEITSGITEKDKVLSIPPNLDPRGDQ